LFDDAGAREILSVFPRPDRVYLLDIPVEVALARLGHRSERTIDENRWMLECFRRRLLIQARREGFVVLDARRPFEENQAAIRADFAHLEKGRSM
jgi:thymidylate kinase